MAAPPLIAATAARNASKALTGDMFVRTTSKVVGKGKKAQVVESTLHINPVTAGVGLAATAVGLGLAAWVLQLKLTPTLRDVVKAAYVWPFDGKLASEVFINQEAPTAPVRVVTAFVWPSDYGFASEIYINASEPESKPTRTVHHLEEGYWDYSEVTGYVPSGWSSDPDYKGPGGWVPKAKWIVTRAAYDTEETAVWTTLRTETAVWTVLSTVKGKKCFSIEQRRGFSAGDVLEAAKDAVGLGAPIPLVEMFLHPFEKKGKWW